MSAHTCLEKLYQFASPSSSAHWNIQFIPQYIWRCTLVYAVCINKDHNESFWLIGSDKQSLLIFHGHRWGLEDTASWLSFPITQAVRRNIHITADNTTNCTKWWCLSEVDWSLPESVWQSHFSPCGQDRCKIYMDSMFSGLTKLKADVLLGKCEKYSGI